MQELNHSAVSEPGKQIEARIERQAGRRPKQADPPAPANVRVENKTTHRSLSQAFRQTLSHRNTLASMAAIHLLKHARTPLQAKGIGGSADG